jgi:transposase
MSVRRQRAKRERRDVDLATLEAIIDRGRRTPISEAESELLRSAIGTLAELTAELERQDVSIRTLRELLFGAKTEKTSAVFGEKKKEKEAATGSAEAGSDSAHDTTQGAAPGGSGADTEKSTAKGHGRNGADAYTGAKQVELPHEQRKHGERCPECARGNLYGQQEPKVLIRIRAMAPIHATVYRLERLRCGGCGTVFTAAAPPGVGEEKYDASVTSMTGLLKYGSGMPFYRLEKLQKSLGIPLPASTQWDLVRQGARSLEPVHDELIRQAAQGRLLHNDDTTARILESIAARGIDPVSDKRSRQGTYTTGIVAELAGGGHRIGLFFTGHHHAGENLEAVLRRRAAELAAPLHMCDGLSHNTAGDFETIVGHCLAHARRYYVKINDIFPEPCRFVLEELREVYRVDARARQERLAPDERLALHRTENGPRMARLKKWLYTQISEKQVEPHSPLGEAIAYMKKHWHELVLFLRQPGAPLDNTIVERALKRAILHRKNSLFYKTLNGALVGDRFMSLIHSAELSGADPFDYLNSLLSNAGRLEEQPALWMPWNYRDTLAELAERRAIDAGPAG